MEEGEIFNKIDVKLTYFDILRIKNGKIIEGKNVRIGLLDNTEKEFSDDIK